MSLAEDYDETAYLLKSDANRQHLLQGIAEVRSGEPLTTMTLEQLAELEAFANT